MNLEADYKHVARALGGLFDTVEVSPGVYKHTFTPIEPSVGDRIAWLKRYSRGYPKKYRRIVGRAIRQLRREHE